MPSPPLKLNTAVETAVFRAFVAVFRTDPVLDRVVKTWEVMDGAQPNLQPPTTSQMPWLRIMAGPSIMDLAEASAWGLDYEFFLSWATAGLNQDDQTNLFGAIRGALSFGKPFVGDVTVEQHLRQAGAVTWKITSPGFGARPMPTPENPSPAQDLFGAARILARLIIPF